MLCYIVCCSVACIIRSEWLEEILLLEKKEGNGTVVVCNYIAKWHIVNSLQQGM